jgi:hypothetical protein
VCDRIAVNLLDARFGIKGNYLAQQAEDTGFATID